MGVPELLAPAGSISSVYAAVQAGADAVYLGVGEFNARANTVNFSRDDLEKAIRYCYPRGTRVYLAMNTLLRDGELSEAMNWVSYAYDQGIHAVIVQDIGLLSVIRETYPNLPIHASTQMNLFSADVFRNASKAGIKRIILPRELSIEQIRTRAEAAGREGVEIEVFIHGALCVSCSGLCLMSAMNGSGERSGNRGQCAQPCREEYALIGSDQSILRSGRIFSMKDQSASPLLAELIRLNIHSLKIEGRMRDADYVRTVVHYYREWIDRLCAGQQNSPEMSEKMNDALLLSFNRGGDFTTGHISDDRSTLPAGNFSGKFGVLIGRIIGIKPQNGLLEISVLKNLPIKPKDVVSIRENNREEASFPIGRVSFSKNHCTLQGLHPDSLSKLKPGMNVYLTKVNEMEDYFDGQETPRRTPVIFRIDKDPDDESQILVSGRIENLFGKAYLEKQAFRIPPDYSGPVLEKRRVEAQLARCSDTPFSLDRVEIKVLPGLRAPVSFVNAIRRTLLTELEDQIQNDRQSKADPVSDHINAAEPLLSRRDEPENDPRDRSSPVALEYISLRLNREKIFRGPRYYIFSAYDIADEDCVQRIEALIRDHTEAIIYVRLPGAYSDSQSAWMEEKIESFSIRIGSPFRGVITSDRFYSKAPVILSHQANLFNARALSEALKSRPTAFSLSEELADKDLIRVMSGERTMNLDAKLIISRYGPVEWMQSVFCPLGQNREGCALCKKYPVSFLRSSSNPRKAANRDFPFVLFHPEFCTSELFGPRKHIRSEETIRLLKTMNIDMIYLVRVLSESPEQIGDIVSSVCGKSGEQEWAEE